RHARPNARLRGKGRSVHAWRRNARRGRLRRALCRLQLDGAPCRRGLRRLRDGHDRLRKVDAAERDERAVQLVRRAAAGADTVRAPGAVRAGPTRRADDDRIGLGRYRCGRRASPRVARYRARRADRLVAGRPARRRLRRQAPGQGVEDRAPRPCLHAGLAGGAAARSAERRGVHDAVARGLYRQLEPSGRLRRPVRAASRGRGLGRDARVGSGRRDLGHRRASRAPDGGVGVEPRRRRRDGDADAARRGRARRADRPRPRTVALRAPRLDAKGADRPGVRVPQRDVGTRPHAPLRRLARVAALGHRERHRARNRAARLRIVPSPVRSTLDQAASGAWNPRTGASHRGHRRPTFPGLAALPSSFGASSGILRDFARAPRLEPLARVFAHSIAFTGTRCLEITTGDATMVERTRLALITTGLASMLFANPTTDARASSSGNDHSVVGMWHAVLRLGNNGPVYDEIFEHFHADGTELLVSNSLPPALGNICIGVWKRTGPRTYKLKHMTWNWSSNLNEGFGVHGTHSGHF